MEHLDCGIANHFRLEVIFLVSNVSLNKQNSEEISNCSMGVVKLFIQVVLKTQEQETVNPCRLLQRRMQPGIFGMYGFSLATCNSRNY